jgi:hypothetical protein
MESSPQSASFTPDEYANLPAGSQDEHGGEAADSHSTHIHLPNPSYWPILLGAGLAIAVLGLLIINITPWLFVIALPLILIAIMGWALEDPMAPLKEIYVRVRTVADPWKYKIGQGVEDSQRRWLGKVQARFAHYVLVERGGLMLKVYYVPVHAIREEVRNNTLWLTMSEEELVRGGFNSVPDDLYEETPEAGFPRVRGAAQFARRPLSPAETGHYNYGRMSPGINTDAGGSYHRTEINPTPQTYVTEGKVYVTDEPIPPRAISSD